MKSIKIVCENVGTDLVAVNRLQMVHHAFEAAGVPADIERTFHPGHINLLFEGFSDEFTARVLRTEQSNTAFIIVVSAFLTGTTFNQVTGLVSPGTATVGLEVWKRRHDNFLRVSERALAIWHLRASQVPTFKALVPHCDVAHLHHMHSPVPVPIRPRPRRDIDFLFIGRMTPHRERVLMALDQKGHRVHAEAPPVSPWRGQDLLSRACVGLDIAPEPGWPFASDGRRYAHLSRRSLLLSDHCLDDSDLTPYTVSCEHIVDAALEAHAAGGYESRSSTAFEALRVDRPAETVMSRLLSTDAILKIREDVDQESTGLSRPNPVAKSSPSIDTALRRKDRALVCFPIRAVWQAHLLASLGEVFDLSVLYMQETLKQVGTIAALTIYTRAFIEETGATTVFLDVERFHRYHDPTQEDIQDFLRLLETRKVYPFLFDDVVYRDKNVAFLKDRKFELVLTACPISVLKYEEQGISARFFPLEGHRQWYFRSDAPRDIDILFYGTLRKGKRKDHLDHLRQAGFSITHAGDEKRSLRIPELCDYIRRAKIVINFSEAFDYQGLLYQFKGRILEAGFCGSLCVSEHNPSGGLLLGPDLPQFSTMAECVELIRHLLTDTDAYERARVAFASRCEHHRPVDLLKRIVSLEELAPKGRYEIQTVASALTPN